MLCVWLLDYTRIYFLFVVGEINFISLIKNRIHKEKIKN